MNTQTKICQNCKKTFVIEPDDFLFYEKMQVPPPTWCPECRMQRLMLWRNERALYRRKDSKYGKDIISIFAPEKPLVVYDMRTWWSDEWDPLEYGQNYDFSKPFFQQFRELLARVPMVPLHNKNAVNSDYCNHCEDMKNCYLSFASIWNENTSYSSQAIHCKDSLDLLNADKSELAYDSISCEGCYQVVFSKNVVACTNSAFLRDCSGCSHCFGCVNLRNKSYYIFNQPYSKEAYEEKIKEFNLGSYENVQKLKQQFADFEKHFPRKFANLVNSPNSTGDVLYDVKNCISCFHIISNVENCKYVVNGGYNMKDSELGYGVGVGELMYEVVDTGIGASKMFAAVVGRSGSNTAYTFNCHNASNIFGCVSLRNKDYCILNKQYSKEEYETLREKIVQHMSDMPYRDKQGRLYPYGEFFPAEIAPFAYNETIVQEYYPLTKIEAENQGFGWQDSVEKNYSATCEPEKLPDHIENVTDAILQETIRCAHRGTCNEQCAAAFRIIPQELEFYKKLNIPLPRLCPNCRHYQRLKDRNPLRLWKRKCMCQGTASEGGTYQNDTEHFHGTSRCPNEFETPYAPDRPEIVYCEACYQSEVI